jgi:hypothetical protein
LTIVQDALANFIEILDDIPDTLLRKKVHDFAPVLKEKLQIAMLDYDIDEEYEEKKILVCNNSCWLLGELASKFPT